MKVDLIDGQTVEVKVALVPIALNDVRAELKIFKGYLPCGFGLVAVTVTASCPQMGEYKPATDTEVTSDIETVLDEMIWKQTSPLSAQRFNIVMGMNERCNPCTFGYSYGSSTGASPVVLRADAEFDGITGEGDPGDKFKIRHRVWVPGSQPPGIPIVVVQQSFEIYTGLYYGEPAPEFASNLPDA